MKSLLLIVCLFIFSSSSQAMSPSQLMTSVNQERQKIGLRALTLDPLLNQAALLKAQDMSSNNYWSHINPKTGKTPWSFIIESGYDYQSAGENLGKGYSDSNSLVTAWMNSPSHRKNILDDRYSQVGVAQVNNIVVLMFAKPRKKLAETDQPSLHLVLDFPPLLPILS